MTTQFVRNGFGEVVQEISPDRGTTSYLYDEAGDVKSMTDARGITVAYQRDILGRIVLKTPGDNAANTIAYDWDLPDTNTTYRLGRLTPGASLLAKAVNANTGFLDKRGVLTFFASKLTPTGACVRRVG